MDLWILSFHELHSTFPSYLFWRSACPSVSLWGASSGRPRAPRARSHQTEHFLANSLAQVVLWFIFLVSCPGIGHFSKAAWFLRTVLSNHNTGIRSVRCIWVLTSSRFQRTELGNLCADVGGGMCTHACVWGHVCSHSYLQFQPNSTVLPCPSAFYIHISCLSQNPRNIKVYTLYSKIGFVSYTKTTFTKSSSISHCNSVSPLFP